MYCSKCGRKIPNGRNSCRYCSAKRAANSSFDLNVGNHTNEKSFNQITHGSEHFEAKTTLLIIILIIILVAIVVTSFFLVRRYQSTRETVQYNEDVLRYETLLQDAEELSHNSVDEALMLLDQAIGIFPERIEAYRSQAFVLYSEGMYEKCTSDLSSIATKKDDLTLNLIMASCYFELGDYEDAADLFQHASEQENNALNLNSLRDYAVCLGRKGDLSQAHAVLEDIKRDNGDSSTVNYIQGEIYYAENDFQNAETSFINALESATELDLLRRCYISLSEVYRDTQEYDKLIDLISQSENIAGLQNNSMLSELLGAAYYSRAEQNNSSNDYQLAAQAFKKTISLGIQSQYLYENVCFCYIQSGDLASAKDTIQEMEMVYPQSYSPHTLRALVLIIEQNSVPENERDYLEVIEEYEKAGNLITSQDDTRYYQQVSDLVNQLEQGGWLDNSN